MGHNHHHHGGKNIRLAFFLNLIFSIIEFIGGLYVNSVSILSDAVHDLGDSFSLGIAWYMEHKSHQKADYKYSFGYQRFSLLGALINSLVLLGGSAYVINEAIQRILVPESSDANGMILFALLGVTVNGYAAWKVSHGKSLNEKVITWHLIEDVLGWVAVLILAIVLLFVDNPYLDPSLSIVITLYILWNVFKRLKETMLVFLQRVPSEVDVAKLEQELLRLEHVDSLHHTHLWSLDGLEHIFSSHIKLKRLDSVDHFKITKEEVNRILNKHRFSHSTVEFEFFDEDCRLSKFHT